MSPFCGVPFILCHMFRTAIYGRRYIRAEIYVLLVLCSLTSDFLAQTLKALSPNPCSMKLEVVAWVALL